VAELRERGTSFQQSSDIVLDPALSPVSDVSRAAFGTVVSCIADDVLARLGNGVDFSSLFVVESNPTSSRVGPLTQAAVGELATSQGVNINARV
jgi:hypothetical protein